MTALKCSHRCRRLFPILILAPILAPTNTLGERIHRSSAARTELKHVHPCPSTGRTTGRCPGWIIDHIKPLACGGADSPFNMQWQTVAAAKAKDQWERIGCRN